MLIGYARVSTQDQDTALQLSAFKALGVEKVFEEKASGAKYDRPVLWRCLDSLRSGDPLVVYKVERAGATMMLRPTAIQLDYAAGTLLDAQSR